MVSIDLKDAYLHVPVQPDSHQFLCFVVDGMVLYQGHGSCFSDASRHGHPDTPVSG